MLSTTMLVVLLQPRKSSLSGPRAAPAGPQAGTVNVWITRISSPSPLGLISTTPPATEQLPEASGGPKDGIAMKNRPDSGSHVACSSPQAGSTFGAPLSWPLKKIFLIMA